MSADPASGFKTRYAHLKGQINQLLQPAKWRLRVKADREAWAAGAAARAEETKSLEARISRLAAMIVELDPSWTDSATPPIRPFERRRKLPHGTFTHDAYGVIGQAQEPLTSREIVEAVCNLRGIPRDDTRTRENLRDGVGKALTRLARDGVVAHDGGKPRRWFVLDEDG